jgi:hypothetical protein
MGVWQRWWVSLASRWQLNLAVAIISMITSATITYLIIR